MQVVIDIDEDTYKDIKRGKIYTSVRDVPQESVVAIANGKPLPKGHGRLIDASNLMTVTDYDGENEKTYVPYSEIEEAPTIIEADKEEKE